MQHSERPGKHASTFVYNPENILNRGCDHDKEKTSMKVYEAIFICNIRLVHDRTFHPYVFSSHYLVSYILSFGKV
jgi:hypothetical protein